MYNYKDTLKATFLPTFGLERDGFMGWVEGELPRKCDCWHDRLPQTSRVMSTGDWLLTLSFSESYHSFPP